MCSDATQPELILQSNLRLLYSEQITDGATRLYKISGEDMRIYIVGCLLLTLTASVQPQFTVLDDRRRSLLSAAAPPGLPASELAEAGFYLKDADRLVCFHCSAKLACRALLASSQSGTTASSPLDEHRTASPNCYFVRFLDFVSSCGSNPRLTESVHRDIGRYVKALRKLNQDLNCQGIQLAASYGYSERQIAVCATRQFMRNSGRFSNRAGDLIELAQRFQPLFAPAVFDTVDVRQLLQPIKLLTFHTAPAQAATAAATAATPATSAAGAAALGSSADSNSNSSIAGGGAPSSRGESGYHSILIGRYDQRSGAWESSSQSLTDEQLRAIEAVVGPLAQQQRSGNDSGGTGVD